MSRRTWVRRLRREYLAATGEHECSVVPRVSRSGDPTDIDFSVFVEFEINGERSNWGAGLEEAGYFALEAVWGTDVQRWWADGLDDDIVARRAYGRSLGVTLLQLTREYPLVGSRPEAA